MDPANEPIAIVGTACRLPGGAGCPDAFWRLLATKTDAVTQVPDTRWSKSYFFHPRSEGGGEPGLSYVWSAGVIDDVERFDAAFFGISPREAEQVDVQQRLMLELAWEALEDAGIPPSRLAGSSAGVFVGVSFNDFSLMRFGDAATMNPYYMSGGALAIAANRVSYALDLHGPSLSVDTACSSSLVALHLACQSLRSGEASFALVGGVNALLSPFPFIGFSTASMLSPSGRCRAFDAGANGYVRAEGGVVLALKPLTAAIRDRDPIHAVILGTGVNSDGRTPGISLPSDRAQEALLRRVYHGAGVSPDRVGYVEAHGTGTSAGDPLELAAIGRFFGPHRRPGDPLLVGSVKTNIGHLESGAGLAGVLKVVLAMKHRVLPANLHFDEPNPQIPFEELRLRVVTEATPMGDGEPLFAGVNSFGFGGTNAHVVLSSFPDRAPNPTERPRDPVPPLYLSARSGHSLKELARRFADLIDREGAPAYDDIAYSAAFHRDLHPQRLVVRGTTVEEIGQRLGAFARNRESPGVHAGPSLGRRGRLALMFSGNGCQWQGMGTELLDREPVFARAIGRFEEAFGAVAGWSIVEELRRPRDRSRLELTEFAQPCLLAIQIGLVEVLRSWKVEPEAVLGHSVGEVAAAWASGALSLDQAAALIDARSRAQELTRGQGRMAAVGMSARQAGDEIRRYDGAVELACINSPAAVTLAGPLAALQDLERRLEPSGVFFRILGLDYAFHHQVLDPIRDDLLAWIGALEPGPMAVPMVSSVTGTPIGPDALGPAYWWDNARKPVLFGPALAHLIDDGFNLFLEVGPHPILVAYARDALKERSVQGHSSGLLTRELPGVEQLESAQALLHIVADAVDRRVHFREQRRFRALPTYPWQREHHWYTPSREDLNATRRRSDHPLLGYRAGADQLVWESRIDRRLFGYLSDHRLGENVVFPAAAYIEMALAACARHTGAAGQEIAGLEIHSPMILEPERTRVARFSLSADDGRFAIESRDRLADQPWVQHVTGRLTALPAGTTRPRMEVPGPDDRPVISGEEHQAIARSLGMNYGPAFQGVRSVRVDGREAWGWIGDPPGPPIDGEGYLVHPVVLDAALQVFIDLACHHVQQRSFAHVPVGFSRIVRHAPADGTRPGGEARPALCLTRLDRVGDRSLVVSFWLLDREGRVQVELIGCRLQRTDLLAPGPRRPGLFEVAARPAQRYDQDYRSSVPDLAVVEPAVQARVDRDSVRFARPAFHENGAPLARAAIAGFCLEALRANWSWTRPLSLDEVIREGRLDERHRRFVQAIFRWLEQDGLAACTDGRWTLAVEPDLPGATAIWRRLVADHPAHSVEGLLLGRVASHLVPILRGEMESHALVPREPGSGTFEHLVDLAPAATILSGALAQTMLEIARRWPRERKLRVLELGARSVRLASLVAGQADGTALEYVLTAEDDRVLPALELSAGALRGVTVALFDPRKSPQDQRLDASSFDVIVAADVLHRSGDVAGALRLARTLLARGGALLVGEQGPDRWHDFVFGPDPDWWARDAAGPVSRRFGRESWAAALGECGFEQVRTVGEAQGPGGSGSFVVSGRKLQGDGPAATAPRTGSDPVPSPRRWLITEDASGPSRELASRLAAALSRSGQTVFFARAGEAFERLDEQTFGLAPSSPTDFARLLTELDGGANLRAIVHLMGFELSEDSDPAALVDLAERRLVSVVHLAQALERAGDSCRPRLVLVTGRAVGSVGSVNGTRRDAILPGQAGLWGLGRVLANEYPELAVTLVDLQGDDLDRLASRLAVEVLDPGPEDEVLLGESTRHVHRIAPVTDPRSGAASGEASDPVGPAENVRLGFVTPGPFSHLTWSRSSRPAPGPGQVEIEVRATGLNFRDVMWAMGLLPDAALEGGLAGPTLGLECAGVVTRVGPGVSELAQGDPVVGFGPQCFARFVVTDAGAVARIPASLTFEEAATVPAAFFTAYYSLKHLARLQPGERVLIHGGAGGVGLAAIQYAGLVAAEIHATAGSEEKREFLRLLGVDRVYDSRSLSFADQILEATGGEGVDVVLNSLAGEAIRRNLSLLKPFGRFVELGKRDLYADTRIGLKPLRQNVSYFAVDVDQVMTGQRALGRRLFAELMGLIEREALRPLVHRAFPQAQAVEAFRHMQLSKHLGKIVVSMDGAGVRTAPPEVPASPIEVDPHGSYLVTGGLSGLGLKTAQWLVQRGARTLILMGRRGVHTDEAREVLASLAARGVAVHVACADVADRAQVARVLGQCGAALPRLKGVVHAAMVLDDGIVRNLTGRRILEVLAPKVLGGSNLHQLTLGYELDFFVMYSSTTTLFGNPGQASYVAANACLEALAHERRRQGLPALTVSWGAISDVGVVAKDPELKRHLKERMGDPGLTANEALDLLDELVPAGRAHVAATRQDWRQLVSFLPAAGAPKFSELVGGAPSDRASSTPGEPFARRVAGLGPEERLAALIDLLKRTVSQVMQWPIERIDVDRPTMEMGLDSLMAVELHVALEKELQTSLPRTAINPWTSIADLAGALARRFDAPAAAGGDRSSAAVDEVAATLAKHGVSMDQDGVQSVLRTVREARDGGERLL
ncbi:MAG: SDR family NAD(P)-dependent oxidoreductase [Candidatus Riflebacteria bacterium]|nr:SDR family NAD(P)-dependent oxidoreductase [Candidatus Riflebacteria bacterium]